MNIKKIFNQETLEFIESYHYSTLFAMMFMKLDHIFEWEITDDITIEHKERVVILGEVFTGESQGPSCAEGFRL